MSLLEYDTHIDASTKRELNEDQIRKGIDLLSPLFAEEITIEPCEMQALHGIIAGYYPVSHDDSDLRFDIVQADYRKREGTPVDERHAGLLLLRKMLKSIDLQNL